VLHQIYFCLIFSWYQSGSGPHSITGGPRNPGLRKSLHLREEDSIYCYCFIAEKGKPVMKNSHNEVGELLSWKVSVGILCRRGMPSRRWGKCAEKNSEGYRSIEMSGSNWSSVWKKGEKGHLENRLEEGRQLEKSRCSFIWNVQTNIGSAWQFSWQFREVDKVYQAREKPGEATRNLFETSTHVIFKRWAQSVRNSSKKFFILNFIRFIKKRCSPLFNKKVFVI